MISALPPLASLLKQSPRYDLDTESSPDPISGIAPQEAISHLDGRQIFDSDLPVFVCPAQDYLSVHFGYGSIICIDR